MGLYTINDRGFDPALVRRLGIIDDLALSLMPEVAATMDLETTPELRFHLGWRRYAVADTVAAVAAQNSFARIRNTSNDVLIVVESFIALSNPLTVGYIVNFPTVANVDAGALSAGVVPAGLDTRNFPNSGGSAHVTKGNNAVPGTANFLTITPGQTPFFPIVLAQSGSGGAASASAGGSGIDLICQTVNQAMTFLCVWRERKINDQEAAL